MPMKTAMQQIREDETGRKMLALTTLAAPVQTISATVNFDDAEPLELLVDAGVIVIDAKVLVGADFDAGTTNAIIFSIGSSTVFGGGLLSNFANAYDVNVLGGAAVTGRSTTGFGSDTPQFLPAYVLQGSAVYVSYSPTGTDPTQGSATVILSYVLAA